MKNPTSSAALVSLLSTAAAASSTTTACDASGCRSLPAFAFAATTPSCSLRESRGRDRRHSRSSNPFARPDAAAKRRGHSRAGGGSRRRLRGQNPTVLILASAAAGDESGLRAAAVPASGITGGASLQQQQRTRWAGGGGEQPRGWFGRRAAGFGRAGPSAGRPAGIAAEAGGSPRSSLSPSFDGPEEGIEVEEDRCIRRLDIAVRLVFADYYSCTDVRETTKSLGVFLQEAIVALELASHSSDTTTTIATASAIHGEPSPARLAARLRARLLESSEKLTYHLDGDDPMVLYRFWMRGRAIDVYERDLVHCPRWIELVSETRRQIGSAPVAVEGNMGTVCYPNGDMFEGQVDSLIRIAETGAVTPQSTDAFVDADFATADPPATASRGPHADVSTAGAAAVADVRTISGLVSLTIDCLEDGLSDEATILQQHMKSPEFGHPLLRLASPSENDPDHPHVPDDPEINPALLRVEQELTPEHIALGERGAKEMMHDRRRDQLDVYLVCAAYRQYALPKGDAGGCGWDLHEEDRLILDDLLKQAAAI